MGQHMDWLKQRVESELGLPELDPPGYEELVDILDSVGKGPPVLRGLLHHRKVPEGTQWRQWDTKGRMWIWLSTSGIEKLEADSAARPVYPPEVFALTGISVYDMNDEEPAT